MNLASYTFVVLGANMNCKGIYIGSKNNFGAVLTAAHCHMNNNSPTGGFAETYIVITSMSIGNKNIDVSGCEFIAYPKRTLDTVWMDLAVIKIPIENVPHELKNYAQIICEDPENVKHNIYLGSTLINRIMLDDEHYGNVVAKLIEEHKLAGNLDKFLVGHGSEVHRLILGYNRLFIYDCATRSVGESGSPVVIRITTSLKPLAKSNVLLAKAIVNNTFFYVMSCPSLFFVGLHDYDLRANKLFC